MESIIKVDKVIKKFGSDMKEEKSMELLEETVLEKLSYLRRS